MATDSKAASVNSKEGAGAQPPSQVTVKRVSVAREGHSDVLIFIDEAHKNGQPVSLRASEANALYEWVKSTGASGVKAIESGDVHFVAGEGLEFQLDVKAVNWMREEREWRLIQKARSITLSRKLAEEKAAKDAVKQ